MTALVGRRALVTGSSRNLGAAIARSLAEAGAAVAVTYHSSPSEADVLVADLHAVNGRQHAAIAGDLTEAAAVRGAVDAAAEALGGGIDVLVNNLGPWAGAPYAELAEDEWRLGIDGNLTSVYLATQAVAGHMRAAGWGRVVNISAGSAFVLDHSVYALAKQSVLYLTRQLALELGPEITVNAIAPGQIEESSAEMEEAIPGSVAQMLARTPGGRFVTRAEVASMVTLLCTPAFDSVTGATIPMDGGWRLPRA